MTPAIDALKELVGALRRVGGEPGRKDRNCGVCHHWASECDTYLTKPHLHLDGCGASLCPGAIARAALSAWERRAPLRDDGELAKAIREYFDLTRADVRGILDIVESHLLGTPGTGEAPR